MSDSERQDEDERPGLGEVFDWRTRRTWAMFLGTYLGLGLGAGVAFIAAQVLVHKLLHLENADLRMYLEFAIGLTFYVAGWSAISLPLARNLPKGRGESVASQLLKSPKLLAVYVFGPVLGVIPGQILIHILQRLIDLPESRILIILLMVVIYLHGPASLIIVSGKWGRPRGESDTQGI